MNRKTRGIISTNTLLGNLLSDVFYQVGSIKKQEIEKHGLNITTREIHTITTIARNIGESMKSLARLLRIDKATFSVNTSRLIKKGYLSKVRDKRDRRYNLLSLTDLGKEAYKVNSKFEADMIKNVKEYVDQDENQIKAAFEGLMHYFMEKY